MTKEIDPRSKALADQLRAEIAGSSYKSIAAFARALNEAGVKTDPTTFFNRVTGKVLMPMDVIWASLDLLGIEPMDYLDDAMRRLGRPPE